MSTPSLYGDPGVSGALAYVGDEHAVLLAGPRADAGAEFYADHLARLGPLPALDVSDVIRLAQDSGLAGRGGGQFPFARKLATAARAGGRAPVVVVNASESEPASHKDRTLLRLRPHLVLDGAALVGRALGAMEVVVHVHRGSHEESAALRRAITQREAAKAADPPWWLSTGPARYVAGEASAVISHIEGGAGRPRWSTAPAAVAGVDGRPTVLSNVETFAHLGVLARLGAERWRAAGPAQTDGPMLVTLHGAVARPGTVVEVLGPVTLGRVLADAGGLSAPPGAVLVGGYAGTWVPGWLAWRTPLDRASLSAAGASAGCGLLAVLPPEACGLQETARIVRWLADQNAGQCGPCTFGLPALADRFAALAAGRARGHAADGLARLGGEIDGRGGCRHPDGVVRLVRSALSVFADHVEAHCRRRACPPSHRAAILPLPPVDDGWR